MDCSKHLYLFVIKTNGLTYWVEQSTNPAVLPDRSCHAPRIVCFTKSLWFARLILWLCRRGEARDLKREAKREARRTPDTTLPY